MLTLFRVKVTRMGRRDRQRFKCPNLAKCRFKRIQCVIVITMLIIFFIIIFTLRDLYISEQIIENTVHDHTSTQQSNVHETRLTPTPTFKPTLKPTLKLTPNPTNKPTNKPTKHPISPSSAILSSSSWTVNWTLAHSKNNLTSENVSESVIWKNDNYNGYCGTQLYPILTNGNGLEYLWVHDVMSIEMGKKVWIFATDPSAVFKRPTQPSIWLGIYNSYFICAFNDGTTVISEKIKFMRRKNLDFLVIICEIPDLLQSDVLSSDVNTSVGVTLFDSRNRSLNIINNNDNFEWKNVTIPICSTFVINRGKHIYHSDGIKYSKILNGKDPISTEKKHKLSACLIVHPNSDYFNQMNIRIVEWIEYGLIMGFSHFYIYDHISPFDDKRKSNDKFIWDSIYYYIKHKGRVTYVEWPFPFSQPWIFQYSFINSCLARFKYDNNYLTVIDIDEYLIPPKRFITVLDVINHINHEKNRNVNMFVLKCKLGTTCAEKLGCHRYFNSFLERHGCLSDDNPPTNPKKYIINPMAHWYAFVHGIPRWKENVNNIAEVFTDIGICLHARDHHRATSFYHNQSIDHVIDFLAYSWKHENIKIHPLFDSDHRHFCPGGDPNKPVAIS